jgi:hypothetical protein
LQNHVVGHRLTHEDACDVTELVPVDLVQAIEEQGRFNDLSLRNGKRRGSR